MLSHIADGRRVSQARASLVGDDGKPLTQAAAADRLGVHPVTLNRIENDKARVSLELLERISSLTGRSREWLLGEPEQVDAIEAERVRLAHALAQISAGFEELNTVLGDRVREVRDVAELAA